MKAHYNADGKIVKDVVVAVQLHGEEGADEICTLYVVVPWGKRLQPGHNFIDPFTKLHEICVVLGRVVYSVIQPLKGRLYTIVREIAPVV